MLNLKFARIIVREVKASRPDIDLSAVTEDFGPEIAIAVTDTIQLNMGYEDGRYGVNVYQEVEGIIECTSEFYDFIGTSLDTIVAELIKIYDQVKEKHSGNS